MKVRAGIAGRLAARRNETQGYVAVMIAAALASGLFMGAAAIAVDTGRWYTEMERAQKAADAAAMGGVPFLPQDFPAAEARAKEIAARNGFPEGGGVTVKVEVGSLDSQLKVTVQTPVRNVFGSMFGARTALVSRSGTADYKAAAPMGSPCVTFGNEPNSGGGLAASPAGSVLDPAMTECVRNPQFWAVVEGPDTQKGNGDRYMNATCSNDTFECTGTTNNEYDENGYFWVVRVGAEAVGRPIDVQLYDPAYLPSGNGNCSGLPESRDIPRNDLNPYVKDAKLRYARGHNRTPLPVGSPSGTPPNPSFCSGDFLGNRSNEDLTTSFLLRHQNDALDPVKGVPIPGCNRQYRGNEGSSSVSPTREMNDGNSSYNPHSAQLFHNWTSMCTFVPDTAGDYYLQVRTNVKFGGVRDASTIGKDERISRDNPEVLKATGNTKRAAGVNAFAIRAVVPGYQEYVSVAGYEALHR